MKLWSISRTFAAVSVAAFALFALPAASAERVTVTQYGTNVATLPWAVALEKGLFKQHGVDVDGILGSQGGGTTIRNLIASGLPFGEVAVPAAVAAVQTGSANLKIVYGAVNNFGDLAWIVKKDSPLKTIADLRGHKIGFTEPRSATEMVLRMILQKAKLGEGVTAIPTGGISAGIVAVDQGAVDAAPFEEPLLLPDPTKYRVLFRVSDYVPNVTWSVGVVTADYAKAHPDVVRKLIEVRRDAVDYMEKHPAEAEAIYAKVWNANDKRIAEILPRLIKDHYWSRGELNMQGLETMLQGMQLVGSLQRPLDTKAVIDTAYLK
jgi:NitT/TauT family transport system substrate-binding protein